MKKLLVILLLLTSVFVLSGCKKDNKDDGNEAPVFTGEATLSIEVGEGEPNWLSLVTVNDTEDGPIVLDATNVNLSNVDLTKAGEFTVKYTVEDSKGKESTFTITVTVSETITPMVSNPDGVYASFGDITITRSEMWNEMVKVYGMGMMQRYVEEILFEDYITALTPEEILEGKNKILFGTNDADMIAEMMEDEDYYAQLLSTFEESLLFTGYNPNLEGDIEAFLALDIAKGNYTKEYLQNATEEDGFYVTPTQLEAFYAESNIGDVCVLTVEFSSTKEFDSVLDEFNLVDNYNFGYGEYFGTTPIEQLSSDLFDETNTTQLTDEQVFSKFVLLYNYMNPNLEQLPENITEAELCSNYADISVLNYDDLLGNINYNAHPIALYAALVFDTLKVDGENTSRFSYTHQNISGDFVVSYKVSEEVVPAFDTLTTLELAELKTDFIDLMTVNEVIASITGILLQETELQLYEPTFRMIFEFENNTEVAVLNSETIVGVYGDIEITADELFNFIEYRLGINIVTDIYEKKALIDSDIFIDYYGSNQNLSESDNQKIVDYYTQMDSVSANFYTGAYVSYGFDPQTLSFREFLFLGFGHYTLDDVVMNVFILPNLQVEYAVGNLPTYEELLVHFELEYNEFFSLSVEHVLIYLDLDNDFVPDDYQEYVDGLTALEVDELTALKLLYETLLFQKLDEGLSFNQIESEYKNGLIDDIENPWAPLKQYGFKIKHEQLNVLGNNTVDYFDDEFVDSLVTLNEALNRPENENVDELVDTKLTTSAFGVHLIKASKPSQFEKPTAEFAEENPLEPVYPEGTVNDSHLLSQAQIDIYHSMTIPALAGESSTVTIPDSLTEAINRYYKPVFDQYVSTWGTSVLDLQNMLDSNPVFETFNTEKLLIMQMQYDNLIAQSYLRTE